IEVFQHPESMPLWIEAGEGRADWDAIFAGYSSTVDYPSAAFWREIASHYPNAKVLHTLRDPDQWFDSIQATILAPDALSRRGGEGEMARFFAAIVGSAPAQLDDRAVMTDFFRRHTEEVRAAISPERLLVYEVGEGWDRLCAFLGVPVPDGPFPAENSRTEFIGRARSLQAALPTP
ncbi:MAG: sulfotransferase family protein, partial [Caulobacteraceae bacterium]